MLYAFHFSVLAKIFSLISSQKVFLEEQGLGLGPLFSVNVPIIL